MLSVLHSQHSRISTSELDGIEATLEEFERVKRATEKITAASGDELRQIEHQVRAVRGGLGDASGQVQRERV